MAPARPIVNSGWGLCAREDIYRGDVCGTSRCGIWWCFLAGCLELEVVLNFFEGGQARKERPHLPAAPLEALSLYALTAAACSSSHASEYFCQSPQEHFVLLKFPTKTLLTSTISTRKQHPVTVKMVPRKRPAADDSSSDEEINMDKMIETKEELSKVLSMPCPRSLVPGRLV